MTDSVQRRNRTGSTNDVGDVEAHAAPSPQPTRAEASRPKEVDWNDSSSLPAGVEAREKNLGAYNENRNVLYFGMNESVIGGKKQNDAEWESMKEQGAHFGVRMSRVDAGHDSIVPFSGKRYDVSTKEGCDALADALHLSDPKVTAALKDVLHNANPEGRDELARFAIAWAPAERVGTATQHTIPSRMIVSAHHWSTRNQFWDGAGDPRKGGNALDDRSFLALAKAMPHAAAQVKDIMFSACDTIDYDGADAKIAELRDAFPNLHSVQGYGSRVDQHSPTGQTAVLHEQNWMYDTRTKSGEPVLRSESQVASSSHEMIWSKSRGIQEGHQ